MTSVFGLTEATKFLDQTCCVLIFSLLPEETCTISKNCFPTLVLDICLEMRWLGFWKRGSLMNSRECD